ncbi:hypothetical protein D0C37_14470 [Streptomyces koyangensis]|uniref:Uncharacterized protein n=1 Tax=Streptomyces koyangensis TaxID=188770 RepID=A0A385DCQ9_9ACTN|nr:hypothetical protein D0C37_14470 [Streptomyces koyangensis]
MAHWLQAVLEGPGSDCGIRVMERSKRGRNVLGRSSSMIQSGPIGVAEQRLGLGQVGRSRIA